MMRFDLSSLLPVNSRLTRDVLWNVASLIFLGAAGMIINSIILVSRGPEDLGIFNQVFAIYIVASQVAVGGIQFSTLKHCSYAQNNMSECAIITSASLILVACISLPVCIVLYLTADFIGAVLESHAVALGVICAVPGLFFFALNKVLIMALNGLRHMRAFAVFQSMRYLLILAGITLAVVLGLPGYKFPLALTMSEIFLFLFLVFYLYAKIFPIEISDSQKMRFWLGQHISFGSRGFLSGILTEMNTRVDVLMVGFFMSDIWVGVYSFGAIFAEGFAQLCTVMRQNLDPMIGQSFVQGRKDQISELVGKIRKRFWPVMGILGSVLVICFPLIIWLFSKEKIVWYSWSVFAVLVIGIVISSGYRPFVGILPQGGRPGLLTMLVMGSFLVNVLLNIMLIPLIGINGSAMATAFVFISEGLAVGLLARRFFGINI